MTLPQVASTIVSLARRRTAVQVPKRRVASALVLMVLLALGTAGTVAAAHIVPVSIAYRAYQPALLEVEAGDTVTWTNVGLGPHTVTADAGQFDSGKLNTGERFSVTFSTMGTFLYSCTVHPTMHGRVVVAAPGSVRGTSVPGPGGGSSQSVKVSLSQQHGSHGASTVVHVQTSHPGAKVLLERYSRTAKWQTVRQGRLSRQGNATLSISATIHQPLRVVVLGPTGKPVLVSRSVRHPA